MNKLFECEIKRQFTEGHIPRLLEYLRQMNELLSNVKNLEEWRSTNQNEYEKEVPKIVEDKLIELLQRKNKDGS